MSHKPLGNSAPSTEAQSSPATSAKKPRGYRRRAMGEEGQAMMEFVITFPWVLFMALAVIQFSLMHLVQNMTDYAAFSAARCATVFVPRYEVMGFGPLGGVYSKPGEVEFSKKFLKIQLAAAVPMTVVSPKLSAVTASWPGIIGQVSGIVSFLVGQLPANIQGIIGGIDRFLYAYAAVSIDAFVPNFGGGVSISVDPNNNNWKYDYQLPVDGPGGGNTNGVGRGDLYVKCKYIMALQIPFINYFVSHYYDGTPRNAPTALGAGDGGRFLPMMGFARVPYEGGVVNQDDEIPQFTWLWP